MKKYGSQYAVFVQIIALSEYEEDEGAIYIYLNSEEIIIDGDVDGDTIDGDDVDAIVQCGTNLSTVDVFPTLEHMLEKPLIPINVATVWHALRACGVEDKVTGKGRLLEEF